MKKSIKKTAFVVATAHGQLNMVVAQPYGFFIKEAGKAKNLFDLNKIIGRGLTYKAVQPLVTFLNLSTEAIAEMAGVSQRTVSRWDDDTVIGVLPSKNLVMVDTLVHRGIDVFGSENAFKDWLQQPNNALGDERPIDLLTTPYGTELVEDAVGAMEYGQVM